MFWDFLKRVVFSFVFVVTGSILALYYIFVKEHLAATPFANKVDVIVLIVGFVVACFLAWRDERLERNKLQQLLQDIKDTKPKYELKLIRSSGVIKQKAEEIDDTISYAQEKKKSAPAPNPFMPNISLHQEPTTVQWDVYIKELREYKKHLEQIASDGSHKIINFTLENKGHSDNNINVHIKFEDSAQAVGYYSEKVELEEPREPSSLLSFIPGIASKQELGLRREVHVDQEDQIEAEINRLHKGEKVSVHYDPIFLVAKQGSNPRISYCVKSDNHQSSEYKTIQIS